MKKTLKTILAACLIVMFSAIAYAQTPSTPTITCVPDNGPAFSDTPFSIEITSDENFPDSPTVFFGSSSTGVPGAVDADNKKKITCQTPQYLMPSGTAEAKVTVTVKNSSVIVIASCANCYTYTAPVISKIDPPLGSACGGTAITITGQYLDGAKVNFAGNERPDSDVSITKENEIFTITFTSPRFVPAPDAPVNVTVTNSYGQTATPSKTYTYTRIPDTERNALNALYDFTKGSEWTNKWNKDAPKGSECCGDWYGVECNADRKNVVTLNLSDNNLTGTIPSAIKDLTKLTELNLSDNQLTGDISTMETLIRSNLITPLDVSWNAFSCTSTKSDLIDLLEKKTPWKSTQTLPPSDLRLTEDKTPNPTATTVSLSWTPPTCTDGEGGYEIEYCTDDDISSCKPIEYYCTESDLSPCYCDESDPSLCQPIEKATESVVVKNLTQCTDYSFRIRSFSEKDVELPKYSDYVQLNVTPPVKTLGIPNEERDALMALYDLTNGDSWNDKTGWKDADGNFAEKGSERYWCGITTCKEKEEEEGRTDCGCDHVTKIELPSNNLFGNISDGSFLAALGCLEILDLGDNRLMGGLPSWKENELQSLHTLLLDRNELEGTIPENFKYLKLEKLSIAGNQITLRDPIPLTLKDFFYFLDDGGSDFRWNKFYLQENDNTINHEQICQVGENCQAGELYGDWRSSQTISPKDFTAITPTGQRYVDLTWKPDGDLINDGGYDIYWSLNKDGNYRRLDPKDISSTVTVPDKNTSNFRAEGLEPGTTYFFKIQTVTKKHGNNKNLLRSDDGVLQNSPVKTAECPNCCPQPVIENITPKYGSALEATKETTITGKNFEGATVKFGNTDIPNVFTNTTYTEIKFYNIPSIKDAEDTDPNDLETKEAVDVTIKNKNCDPMPAFNFYIYYPPPKISNDFGLPIDPRGGYAIGGFDVTITGKNFVKDVNNPVIATFDGKYSVECKTDDSSCETTDEGVTICKKIICTAPNYGKLIEDEKDVPIVVKNPDGQTSPSCGGCNFFTYERNPIPVISSINPNNGPANLSVTIRGKDLKYVKDVKFAGKSPKAGIAISWDSRLKEYIGTCRVPELDVEPNFSVPVILTNPDDLDSSGDCGENCKFTYKSDAIIIDPPEGPSTGKQVTIILKEDSLPFASNATVTFDGVSVTRFLEPITDRKIVCIAPEHKDSKGNYVSESGVNVIVSNPGGQQYEGTYTYYIIPDKEKQALDDLFNNMGGSKWDFDTEKWRDSVRGTECDGWYGVYCNDTKTHVIKIDLPGQNLSGTLPPSIGDFEFLQILNLSGNGITGTIPEGIVNLLNLKQLNLYGNELIRDIPPEIVRLKNLENNGGLDFRNNKCLCVSEDCRTDATDPNYDLFQFLSTKQDKNIFETYQVCCKPIIEVAPTTPLILYEKGEDGKPFSDIFTVLLKPSELSAPTGDVVIELLNYNESECKLSSTSLTLNAANNFSQTVKVEAIEDGIEDGTNSCTIITKPSESSDPDYNGIDPDNVTVYVKDSDTKLRIKLIEPSMGEWEKELQVWIVGTGFDSQTSVTVTGDNDYSQPYSPSVIKVNERGDLMTLTLKSPTKKDTAEPVEYKIEVSNSKGEKENASVFFGNPSRKQAFIIAGGDPDATDKTEKDFWIATQKYSGEAYNALINQQYRPEKICYLRADYPSNPNADVTTDGKKDVDEDSTLANLEKFIKEFIIEAKADINNDYELLIYMVGPGGDGFFKMKAGKEKTEQLFAETLNGYLKDFPGRVILIYDACMSGSFISKMTPPAGQKRIVITGTAENEPAHFAGDISFSHWFWDKVKTNNNLKNCFDRAKNMMSGYKQTVSVNADGDTTPNEDIDDMDAINDITIGYRKADPVYPKIQGEYGADPEMLCDPTTSATLWVKDISSKENVAKVEARIVPLDSSPSSAVPIMTIPLSFLEDTDADGRYEATYEFGSGSSYNVSFFVRDKQNVVSDSVSFEIKKECPEVPVITNCGVEPQTLCADKTSATLWVSEIMAKETIKNVKAEIQSLDSSPAVTVSPPPEFEYVGEKKRYEATYDGFTGNAYNVSLSATDVYGNESEACFFEIKRQTGNITVGDINNDSQIDLRDAVTVLQILTGVKPKDTPNICAEVDNDGQIGLAELAFILREIGKCQTDHIIKGDVNNDCTVDLKDVITVLQILTTGTSNEKPVIHAEVDNDGKIGLAEAVFILREIAK